MCLGATTSGERQTTGGASKAAWTPPLTPDGRPDLSGFWTNDTYTPLERPAELAGKEFFTPQEAAAFVKGRVDRLIAQPRDDIHYDDAIWQAEKYDKQSNLRTSLIVDPKDGKLPPITPEAQARLKSQFAAQRAATSDSAQSRSLAERCISWGNVGPPMLPPTYNANMQILQSRDVVILRHEMMHDVRMVYLDGRAHPSPKVQWLAGHSVGRWDGHTLVVDTSNFTDRTNFRGSPQNTRQDIFASEALRVVERFTPTGPGTLTYTFTVEDPKTWSRPWSGEMPIRSFEGPLYEYACHEGNYGLPNILRAARVEESRAAASSGSARP
jgi:hypothetical protein